MHTQLKQEARAIAKQLPRATAYEIAGSPYVVVRGSGDNDTAYEPHDAQKLVTGKGSAVPVITRKVALAYFRAEGRSLADGSGAPLLADQEIKLLAESRGAGYAGAI